MLGNTDNIGLLHMEKHEYRNRNRDKSSFSVVFRSLSNLCLEIWLTDHQGPIGVYMFKFDKFFFFL